MQYEPFQLHELLDQPNPAGVMPLASSDDPQQRAMWDEAVELHDWVHEGFGLLSPSTTPDANESWQRLKAQHPEVTKPLAVAPTPEAPSIWRWWQGLQWAAAAAMACALVLLVPNTSQPKPQNAVALHQPALTHKGAQPIFRVVYSHRRHDLSGVAYTPGAYASPGQRLYPGDLVQFRYKLPQASHVMFLSLNQRGEVFSFMPYQGKRSLLMQGNESLAGTLPKGKSLLLDDYIGPELFLLVASKERFTYQQIRYALQRIFQQQGQRLENWPSADQSPLAKSPLTKGWQIQGLLVQKRAVAAGPFAPQQRPLHPAPRGTIQP